MKLNVCIAILSSMLMAVSAFAGGPTAIELTIKRLQPTSEILSIKETSFKGLYEVNIKDFESLYMSEDGRYFFSGNLMHMQDDGRVVNLTEEKLRADIVSGLRQVPLSDQIIYAPKEPKAKIYVFTDVDCGYCRKFHTEIDAYTAMGVEVHYLAYPRGGTDSESFAKMKNVWCAKDRKAALAKVKAGGDWQSDVCNSPVARQYQLGQTIGVKGTPAIYLEDGTQVGGYLSPAQLKKALTL